MAPSPAPAGTKVVRGGEIKGKVRATLAERCPSGSMGLSASRLAAAAHLAHMAAREMLVAWKEERERREQLVEWREGRVPASVRQSMLAAAGRGLEPGARVGRIRASATSNFVFY